MEQFSSTQKNTRLPSFAYNAVQLPKNSTHIRLLHLMPSKESACERHMSAPIQCTLSTVRVDSPPPFKALSYMWGSPEQPRKWLRVSETQLDVTESLDKALRHLRHQSDVVTLWIDQVCINQSDIPEKNDQVALMSKIYRKADEVLVWLEEAANDSDFIMDAWRSIGNQAVTLKMQSYYTVKKHPILLAMFNDESRDDETTRQFMALTKQAGLLLKEIWPAMSAWYQRLWFTRVWVIQEFSLNAAPIFICGDRRVPAWHVLMAEQLFMYGYTRFLMKLPDGPHFSDLAFMGDAPTVAFFGMWRQRQKYADDTGEGEGLLELLVKTFVDRDMRATDERDRIYALLGLAVDQEKLGVCAEYGNRDIQEVLTQAALALIRAGHLNVLSYSRFTKVLKNLPSWVPEWQPKTKPSFYPTPRAGKPHLFSAAKDTPAVVLASDAAARTVGLKGYMVDIVQDTGLEWRQDNWDGNHGTFLTFLQGVKAMHEASVVKNRPIYDNPHRRAEAVWRVPIADMYYDNPAGTLRAVPLVVNMHRDFVAYCELFDGSEISADDPGSHLRRVRSISDHSEGANQYYLNLQNVVGMKPFSTEEGYLGMAASEVRPGDVVVVFQGGRVPYVLRPVQGRDYEFVGEAYCDGIMDGEILTRAQPEEFYLV